MRNFSDEELISRIWDIEEIKKLIHRRVYYQAEDRREDELSDLWVREPQNRESASFGRNWGYYTGMDNIYNYYVKEHYKKLDEQKNENHASNINQGNIYAHPVSTGLVKLQRECGILLRRRQKRFLKQRLMQGGYWRKLR